MTLQYITIHTFGSPIILNNKRPFPIRHAWYEEKISEKPAVPGADTAEKREGAKGSASNRLLCKRQAFRGELTDQMVAGYHVGSKSAGWSSDENANEAQFQNVVRHHQGSKLTLAPSPEATRNRGG